MIYAAYGSNLNHDQMSFRCPLARFIGTAKLLDHRLVFRGVADVEQHLGSYVAIGLWEISKACIGALDKYEGYPHLYTRSMVEVETKKGNMNAIIYYMNAGDYQPPMRVYLNSICYGYKDCGLPLSKLGKDIKEFSKLYESQSQWWQKSNETI